MAGRHSTVHAAANDDSTAKTNQMDLWRDSIQRAQQNRQTAAGTAKSEQEARTDLEQKIRNGQVQCPTCANRTYRDESSDGGVSFQAARHISSATAGVTVMNHEQEHVAAGASKGAQKGVDSSSTVALEHATCPDCGRRHVAGGVTKTTTRPRSYSQQAGGLDTTV